MDTQGTTAQELFDGSVATRVKVERIEAFSLPHGVVASTAVLHVMPGLAGAQVASGSLPWGEIKLSVTDPVDLIKLQPGREFFLTLVPLPKVSPPPTATAAERVVRSIERAYDETYGKDPSAA